ncbi:hypothetical protein L6Q96_19915 [Candidatus Binatia bacterium]|nr:hypothetical protein [Candidatus Binatia bacterium]
MRTPATPTNLTCNRNRADRTGRGCEATLEIDATRSGADERLRVVPTPARNRCHVG